MSELSRKQERHLSSLGKPVIDLPAEINFNGDERLQKSHCTEGTCAPGMCICGKGMHQLPEFQYTGTYDEPRIVTQRERVASDRRGRLMHNQMSVTEMKKIKNMDELKIPENQKGFIQEQIEHKKKLMEVTSDQNDANRGRPRMESEPVNPMEGDVISKVASAKGIDITQGPALRSEVKATNK